MTYKQKVTLYHVSPAFNQAEILEHGVLPSKAVGKWKASWWVALEKIDWALAHCSARHDVPTSQLLIFSIVLNFDVFQLAFRKTPWKGVYRTDVPITVREVESANSYFLWRMNETEVRE